MPLTETELAVARLNAEMDATADAAGNSMPTRHRRRRSGRHDGYRTLQSHPWA